MIGTITHTLQLLSAGWIIFAAAPLWMNVYWTALTVLDLVAAVLLLRRRPTGLVLGIAIMLSDVGINSYALYGLSLPFIFTALQAQTLFCGFLLSAAGLLCQAEDGTMMRLTAMLAAQQHLPAQAGYPIDWAQLSSTVRFDRAGRRWERCARPHLQRVAHLGDGRWWMR